MNRIIPSMSHSGMYRANVFIRWEDGLHLRPAANLVKEARKFHSTIYLKSGGKIADLRSILSIIALCATLGAGLDIEATGDDEKAAAQAIEQVFLSP